MVGDIDAFSSAFACRVLSKIFIANTPFNLILDWILGNYQTIQKLKALIFSKDSICYRIFVRLML